MICQLHILAMEIGAERCVFKCMIETMKVFTATHNVERAYIIVGKMVQTNNHEKLMPSF